MLEKTSRTRLLNLLGIDVWAERIPPRTPTALEADTDVSASASVAHADPSPTSAGLTPPDDTPEAPPAGTAELDAARSGGAAALAQLGQSLRSNEAAGGGFERTNTVGHSPATSDNTAPATPDNTAPITTDHAAPAATHLAAPAAAAAEEQFSVLVLTSPTMLLLLEGTDDRQTRRLGADILATCAGIDAAGMADTTFHWPQGNLSGPAERANRALRAFLDKRLDDMPDVAVLLICAGVAERLAESLAAGFKHDVRVLRMPPVAQLLVDVDAKRQLWRDLQTLLR